MRRTVPLLLALAACSRTPSEPAGATGAEATPTPAPAETAPPRSGAETTKGDLPLLWNDPPGFVRTTPRSPARAAEYYYPHAPSDPEDADCVVMTFGPNAGGTVDQNVARWIQQFHPALPTPRRTTVDVHGMRATFVEVTGTYAGNLMPDRRGMVVPSNKAGWRMLGAIVESPTGLWFFKLTGPDLTVRMAARGFEDMVRSARPR